MDRICQSDSTSQALDWAKEWSTESGYMVLLRQQARAQWVREGRFDKVRELDEKYGPPSGSSLAEPECSSPAVRFLSPRILTSDLTVWGAQAPMVTTENEEVMMQNNGTTAASLTMLPDLTRPELLELWQTLWGQPAPRGLRRELMIPILAYRAQEKARGGLKPETERRLCQLSASLDGGRASPPKERRVKPGTRLLREWRGQTHEVIATERGFLYQGKSQKSLSGIARQITGTRWSGPVFFGLKSRGEGNSER